ncbi:anti-sigma factor [Nocardia arthritidis]|uniref:anti-sigma factor n=1 Tax=Nocardia arthritidis TaxID=228602 RepID=UPI0007A3AC34|nr:anti-sigma factor [Nocardia arthritidis]
MTGTEFPRADLLDLAYPYAMDAVAEIERRRIENRLVKADSGTAAAFAAAVHGIRETLAALSATAAVNPPPTLESKILGAIDDSRPGARRRREVLRHRRLARLMVAAAVAVTAGVGAVVVAERNAGSHAVAVTAEQVSRQPDARSRVIELSGGGTLTVHTCARLGAVAVTLDAVPAPPPGRAYQLWVVSSAGTPRSAGVLTGVPQAGVATGFDPADVLAVTIEPAKGSPRPTSPQIAAITLG